MIIIFGLSILHCFNLGAFITSLFGYFQDSFTIVFDFLGTHPPEFLDQYCTRILALAAEVLAFLGAHQRHLLLHWLRTHHPNLDTLHTFEFSTAAEHILSIQLWHRSLDGKIGLSFDPPSTKVVEFFSGWKWQMLGANFHCGFVFFCTQTLPLLPIHKESFSGLVVS